MYTRLICLEMFQCCIVCTSVLATSNSMLGICSERGFCVKDPCVCNGISWSRQINMSELTLFHANDEHVEAARTHTDGLRPGHNNIWEDWSFMDSKDSCCDYHDNWLSRSASPVCLKHLRDVSILGEEPNTKTRLFTFNHRKNYSTFSTGGVRFVQHLRINLFVNSSLGL